MSGSAVGMDQLIAVVNELHDTFAELKMDVKLDLPQIAVVGSQSSGKSSVLESVVGKDFLPRGTGIVTRCPLVLQLNQLPASQTEEWAEFLHKPGVKMTDFMEVRQEIENRTREVAGPTNITMTPINLKVYSPKVLNLTLVDLPGLVMNAVGDQPKDIDKQIKDMVLNYIKPQNTIILAITPANSDIATSAALRIAKQVDPEGLRTIGVLTKLDLMDRGTDAMDILQGSVYQLRRGFIGVVNRGQMDINENKPMDEARKSEREYFETHPSYCRIASKCGTEYLTKQLNTMLLAHIQQILPDLKAHVDKLSAHMRRQQEKLGMLDEQPVELGAQVLHLIKTFSDSIASTIDGDNHETPKTELVGGARIDYIFHECYVPYVHSLKASKDLTDEYIRITIRNRTGMQPTLFPSDQVFITLTKQQIHRLEDPSLKCVNFVHDELIKIVEVCSVKLDRFPKLKEKIHAICASLLRDYKTPTVGHVKTLIAAEEGYINIRHPAMQERIMRSAMPGAADQAVAAQQQQQAGGAPSQHASPQAGGRPGAAPQQAHAAAHQQMQHPQPQAMMGSGRNPRMDDVPRQILLGSTMTDFEIRQNESIRQMVEGYFNVVQQNVSDQVPKLVTLLMIHKLREDIYPRLVRELYKESLYEELLQESSDIATQRKATKSMVKCLTAAQEALNRVRDIR